MLAHCYSLRRSAMALMNEEAMLYYAAPMMSASALRPISCRAMASLRPRLLFRRGEPR